MNEVMFFALAVLTLVGFLCGLWWVLSGILDAAQEQVEEYQRAADLDDRLRRMEGRND